MRKVTNMSDQQKSRLGRRVIVIAISGVLLVQPVSTIMPGSWQSYIVSQADASTAPVLKLKQQSIITSGAKRLDYVWHTTRKNKSVQTDVHVIEVDLTNPHVSLNAMSGKNNSVGQRNNILNMTKESGAVAGINGDVFVMTNEGAPLGAQVTSGTLVSSPSRLKGMYAFAVTSDRKPIIDAFEFSGTVTAENGQVFPLEGVNQSTYYPEVAGVTYSHVDKMFIYTRAWGGAERPKNSSTKPTEVLVRDGIIEQITYDTAIQGEIPENGYILRAHGKAATFIKDNMQIGQAATSIYSLVSQTNKTPIDPASLQMLVGGHTLLVENGAASPFSRDIKGVSGSSYTSRSAVGYSADGTKVYMITSEKAGSNTGLSLKELQDVMVQLGVHKGVNLDGGGSTTMTERPLGGTSIQLSHQTQESSQRSVSNGIGVFTTAPQGSLQGMIVGGSNVMLLGGTAQFSVKGYDTYYNPITVDPTTLKWSNSSDVGSFQDNVFTASKIGKTKITVSSGEIQSQYDVEVIGQEQIASMKINNSAGMLTKGSTLNVPVTIKLKNGRTFNMTGDALTWEFVGFSGSYKNGAVVVDTVEDNTTTGYAIARYDGYGTMVPFVKGEQAVSVEDFEVSRYAITTQVTPADTTKGSVKLVSDLPEQKSSRALQINYDFSGGTGTRAVYAMLSPEGRTIAGTPTSMTMDVYSDNSKNWVRAEFVDAKGKAHLLDVAKELNWNGWKNVKIDLAASEMAFPAKLKRIYVVTIDKGSELKATSGSLAIDNIMLRTAAEVSEPTRASIVMNVGNTKATVNGNPIKLEAAPLIQNGSTYVPLRFVSEAMGAKVEYDDKTRRVTVLRGNQMIEMTIGKKEYLLNGVRYTSNVAPFTRNGRTLIPVRLFTEKLGFKVGYEEKLKKITID
ncbi:phosphodiester glycosidase family protein [Paenibacillus sp. GSMTC-2017]|uniref:stalk domain-containing protein n=1 Tax=Paenibacillus sp. GSMTC-2017 TaxID=2794350 RepID=UPI0018D9E70E|nr:stalk domain-containing protein [Paenibacillus sp. GSMTC-2017]MBH5320608.1 phosphodiester glycosidase family protein [Paenibacillus sp. GSMTC-2017]